MTLLKQHRLTLKDQIWLWEAVVMLLQSGMNLLQAIQSIHQSSNKTVINQLLNTIETGLKQGLSLSHCLAPFVPSFFDRLSWQLIQMGEYSGHLDQALTDIIRMKQKRYHLLMQLHQALIYPLLTLSVGIIIIILLMTIVLPEFQRFYDSFNQPLPTVTIALMYIAHELAFYGWVGIIMLIAGFIGLKQGLYYSPYMRHYFYLILLKLPLIGSILYYHTLVHCFRHLQLLNQAGLPLDQSLAAATRTIMIPRYQALFYIAYQQVQTGQKLSSIFDRIQLLTHFQLHILKTGEQAGRLDQALANITLHCEDQLSHKLNNLQQSLGPAIMLLLSLLVAFILIAMYLPMFKLGQAL